MWRLWIDTGGTFTDCIGFNPDGKIHYFKLLSSSCLRGNIKKWLSPNELLVSFSWPLKSDIFEGYSLRVLPDKGESVIESIDFESGIIKLKAPVSEIHKGIFEISSQEEVPILAARILTHTPLSENLPSVDLRIGSTKGTNALLERKGARTGLIVTKGFRDILNIGNQQRPHLFSMEIQKPPPFYSKVLEVDERLNAEGNVERPIDLNALAHSLDNIESPIESFAVATMHSYVNPIHEQSIFKLLNQQGFSHISLSSTISPSIKFLDRTQTAVVNAYLDPVITEYLKGIREKIKGEFRIMTSAGGIVNDEYFRPKDSLLSGPAGGVVGAVNSAKQNGINRLITLDMGGTSTDVALYHNQFDYRYVTEVNQARIQAPALAIDTIAAGGGSIVGFNGHKITIGPESAGASPGPACYGDDGPLTITDINLLSGKISPDFFNVPLYPEASRKRYDELVSHIEKQTNQPVNQDEFLISITAIADEMMAEAIRKISIRKGFNPNGFTLLSFGGAGGQHACQVAELLDITDVLIPYEAGILSAKGIGEAEIEFHSSQQVLKPLDNISSQLESLFISLEKGAGDTLSSQVSEGNPYIRNRFIYMRFTGQEECLEIEYSDMQSIEHDFHVAYRKHYGHWLENQNIEVESVKIVAAIPNHFPGTKYQPHIPASGNEVMKNYLVWENLKIGQNIQGPVNMVSGNSTVHCPANWNATVNPDMSLQLRKVISYTENKQPVNTTVELELFTNRFKSVAEEMGAVLERSSFSVNVRDRLDFSCGVLDKHGELVVNAPHIPVHLGSLGLCVREVIRKLPLDPGDICITNHPGFGGSHLPDVTLITPFYYKGQLIAYLANRAHHAEIGGKSPGSMPADAKFLEEEGVIIPPFKLVSQGVSQWEKLESILSESKYPTRALQENLADLRGGIASLQAGLNKLHFICEEHSKEKVEIYMKRLKDYAAILLEESFKARKFVSGSAEQQLDDGSSIKVKILQQDGKRIFDFEGSSPVHPGNLNATPAIVQSAVLYVLRLLVARDIPLNEGLLKNIEIKIPRSFLNPHFSKTGHNPAVVGGNTEVSQRLCDTLIKALNLMACGQGTMNNLLFGNENFGYYETICGGAGAGEGFDGADAVHTHMTNTKITDPEILELRYPVRVREFSINEGTGGKGKFHGGNGIRRILEFTEDVTFTCLTQHRIQAPFGMKGGEDGKTGRQWKRDKHEVMHPVKPIDTIQIKAGEGIQIDTPGGGGYGSL